MKNPGFIFNFTNKTKFRFMLNIRKIVQEQVKDNFYVDLNLCIIKIEDNSTFSLIYIGDNFMSTPWGFISK